MLAEKFVT